MTKKLTKTRSHPHKKIRIKKRRALVELESELDPLLFVGIKDIHLDCKATRRHSNSITMDKDGKLRTG